MGILTGVRKSNWLNLFFRSLQLIDALVIIGMYGVDLNNAAHQDKYADGKWVFAVTTGSVAALTALLYSIGSMVIQYRTVALLFAWDWVMVILFSVLSGIFGSMYIPEKVEMESGIHRMKLAVGFDFAGLALWFLTAAFGTWWFFSERRTQGHVARSTGAKA